MLRFRLRRGFRDDSGKDLGTAWFCSGSDILVDCLRSRVEALFFPKKYKDSVSESLLAQAICSLCFCSCCGQVVVVLCDFLLLL